ncbi:MAG TPA: hypothetical protein VEQ11_18535 [Chloroflexota bacterium]|nr:hypothetical protein [Chloroflexota bacterium]
MTEPAEAPTPIGLGSRDLALILAQALRDLRGDDGQLDESVLIVVVAAAIEANNHKLYEGLRARGALME